MRDLLDKIQSLFESTGLAGRKPGDTFKNPEGETITFKTIEFYPNEGGKLSKEDLETNLATLGQQVQVQWQNAKTAKTGGYAIATFDTPNGEVNYGFYKDSIKPDPTNNYIPNQIGSFRFAGKAAEKIQSGLTPQDLLTKRDNLTADDIVKQLSNKLGENHPLTQLTSMIASGQEFPITFPAPEGVSFTGFRDYFCEILQPIALQNGQYKGNAGEAAERFMDGSFADSLISFDAAKNAGLSDSILTKTDGKYIKISTKGSRGATASVKNLTDALKELEQSPNGQKLTKKYKDTIELVNRIEQLGQKLAPLQLGVEYGIIDTKDYKDILNLKTQRPINLENIDQLDISNNLKTLAKERETDDKSNVNLFYHLIASVAHLVAKKINDDTDFSAAASDILNNGALVQMYTDAKDKGKEWELKIFNTVYPGKSIEGVYLTAGKTYYSTGIKGNFTFRINKGGAKPTDDEPKTKKTKDEKPSTEKDFEKKAQEIVRGRREPFKKEPKLDVGVGRKKRK